MRSARWNDFPPDRAPLERFAPPKDEDFFVEDCLRSPDVRADVFSVGIVPILFSIRYLFRCHAIRNGLALLSYFSKRKRITKEMYMTFITRTGEKRYILLQNPRMSEFHRKTRRIATNLEKLSVSRIFSIDIEVIFLDCLRNNVRIDIALLS